MPFSLIFDIYLYLCSSVCTAVLGFLKCTFSLQNTRRQYCSAYPDEMDDKGPMMLTVCWVFTALALLFVSARFYVRAVVHDKLGFDDYIIIFSCFCAVLSNIFVTISVSWGNGRHFADLNLEQKENTIKWMMAAYFPGIETLGFPKLAVIALLVRLLVPSRLHTIVLWSMGTICCLSLTAMVMTLLLQCTPTQALWTLTMPHNCLAPELLEGLAYWASNFYLAIYPATVLWKLQMHTKKKLALCCALGMGLVSGAVGIIKATGVSTLSNQDVSYELCDPLYWTSVEGNLIIIAACIPLLQPLVEKAKGRSIWRSRGYKTDSNNDDNEHYAEGTGNPGLSKSSKQTGPDAFEMGNSNNGEDDSGLGNHRDEMEGEHGEHDGGILQTRSVTVAYDQVSESGGETTAATRWAAV
ncbi:hypothetical protein NCU02327 [Neurospora crassa OR74A]|uniref:Rhodopsin domain-containing protein n=1 Tax=Neurospora crassa (strain ATCC 24698 / 74-OR23-1A / CBS 708.71 / DSM 1257 / FGSC 987) TaxID=367110 RepID=V5ILL6_NEUCR|nr:hypothetical protein NCU02327 [Neurospora crassa OR74A]ESA41994.1 hypothetical protein NCU02327 [Neurospora crassa OR74A]|eukprot:XP_011395138.1 hypothetical protein NCU02327 [Neurospora crassa OR74A]